MFEQMTARELAEKLDAGEDDFALVDTRSADSYESWHVPGSENVPFGPSESLDDETRATVDELADGRPIVTVCGKGATSTALAAELDERGYEDVFVVKGGMRDWNALYERARIETENDDLVIVQFQRRAKGCLSYLVGSRSAGEAIVVDPSRHAEQYAAAAAEERLDVAGACDTHVHADHLSGGRELAGRLDVPYYLGARAADRDPNFEFAPLEDGETIRLGDVEIEAIHAPGHTSEMVNYRVGDEAILTGDALFLDSVGRTELEFGDDDAEAGAEMAYETLHGRLFDLPDDVTVLPGHVAVTEDNRFENASAGDPVAATVGEVCKRLDLADLDREAFVERLTEEPPEKPSDYETVIAVNLGEESIESYREAASLETGANNCSS